LKPTKPHDSPLFIRPVFESQAADIGKVRRAAGEWRHGTRKSNADYFHKPSSRCARKATLVSPLSLWYGQPMEISLPTAVMPDYFEKLEARILQEFAEGVAAWGQSVTALAQWEDEHLLEAPNPEALAAHHRTVEKLIAFGRFLALTTEHPDFPDAALKENVAATLQTLRDKIPLWHGQIPKDKADAILKAAFPE
jgi:hypothetical protein